MKYIFLLSLFIALSCKQQKKVFLQNDTVKSEKIITEIKKPIIVPQENLIVVLKNHNNVSDAKALIENSSLVWEKLVINDPSLKAALIKVPLDKKDFWIQRLKMANVFTSIEVETPETLASIKNFAENTYVSVTKTPCFGDCPVYEVTLFKNRKVHFNGIANVLVKGNQEFLITERKMNRIIQMFNKTSFVNYPDSYADKSLMDFPNTLITHKNKQIEIKLWKKVPLELAFAFEAFEDILLQKKLIE